ncbi:MAG: glycosyltransferase, partial [Solirubrobacterales bacterium]|nr:glycosyltransferase [Solirubrobacterales bacterium]
PPLPPHSRLVSRYVGPEEQAELFATADIAVLPYQRSERFGFSGVLATALGAAKPTIVSDLPGFKEVITSGAVAAVPPDDPDALAGALQNLIDDQRARARLAAAAADAAATTYSWSRVAEATLSVYRSLL